MFAMFVSNIALGRTWTKKDLQNAGFKFGREMYSYSDNDVIYGKKINGKLNGIVVIDIRGGRYIGYMVDGEMAAPYIDVYNGHYNLIGINEDRWSYNAKDRYPMTLIADEIFGINTASDDTRIELYEGRYNINKLISSFDDFILSGNKIPQNAWYKHNVKITGIDISNSNPIQRIPLNTLKSTLEYNGVYNCDSSIPERKKTNNGFDILNEKIPLNFNPEFFSIKFDYNPGDNKATGGILYIEEIFIVSVEKNELIISATINNAVQEWRTGCFVTCSNWNKINITCLDGWVLLQTNYCCKFADMYIDKSLMNNKYKINPSLISKNEKDVLNGQIRNISIRYR